MADYKFCSGKLLNHIAEI